MQMALKEGKHCEQNYDFLHRHNHLVKADITIRIPEGCTLNDLGIRREAEALIHRYGFFILNINENDKLTNTQRFKNWREQLHSLLGDAVRQPYSNSQKSQSNENATARQVLAEYGVDLQEHDVLMMSNPHDRVKGNKYNGDQKIHQDSTFLKVVPHWVVFTVLQNAVSGGETRLASGQHLLNAIPLPFLVALREQDAVTFFREGTDGHLQKSVIDYHPLDRCITTGYRADDDVDYRCKNALTKAAMDWVWEFNQQPCNYTSFRLEALKESLVVANRVAFHGREGFENSDTQVRKVLRWTFDNQTNHPLYQGIQIPQGGLLEEAIISQSISEYLKKVNLPEAQRHILTQLNHLQPEDRQLDTLVRELNLERKD